MPGALEMVAHASDNVMSSQAVVFNAQDCKNSAREHRCGSTRSGHVVSPLRSPLTTGQKYGERHGEGSFSRAG